MQLELIQFLSVTFFCLRKLLKRGVTNIGIIAALADAGFADYGVVLVKYNTSSKAW